jgi:hypothetical protein
MRKFVRQKANGGGAPDSNIDFGAASSRVARTFEPAEYHLRIQSAKVIQHNENILVVLDLVEVESGGRVDTRPLWVDGPRADSGNLVAENQHLVAQLLTLAKLQTSGNVGDLVPKLSNLEFDASLVLAKDNRSGRAYNAIAAVYMDDAS